MDLFGDLPEPERAPRPSAGKEAQGRPVLFEDLPPASSTDSGSGGPLLFDDLPPAASGNSGSFCWLATGFSRSLPQKKL
ncbi:integrin-linked kinase-associated serine/threonine phosphatase 2C, isoform CRA_k [Mus musculus]|uniref:Integrin-linked kinase-associated serine/threonine phosphatase 2C n=1 Tax=Mus musculus TaxID=10090 RepID=A0A087WPM3_MOUSE|nr:integrin-linked kinase-associated serine/threonine phosphatase 2C, isoform CRA_k [Mus musculus]